MHQTLSLGESKDARVREALYFVLHTLTLTLAVDLMQPPTSAGMCETASSPRASTCPTNPNTTVPIAQNLVSREKWEDIVKTKRNVTKDNKKQILAPQASESEREREERGEGRLSCPCFEPNAEKLRTPNCQSLLSPREGFCQPLHFPTHHVSARSCQVRRGQCRWLVLTV